MTNETILRPLYLAKILNEQTDEDHWLSTVQLCQILRDEYGFDTHRQTLNKDIQMLQKTGMDIHCQKSTQNRYRVMSRHFQLAELKLLIDAVASSKFISKKKSAELAVKLASLAGNHKEEELKRHISVENRIKSGNEKTLLIIDAINEAISQKRQIRFQYFKYNSKKKREPKWNGYWYHMSPHSLVWNGDYYYVIGFSEKYGSVVSYRVDRMVSPPEIMEAKAYPMPKGFNLDKHINSMFRMYSDSSARTEVILLCENDMMDAIIDRFGEKVNTEPADEEHFRAMVSIAVNKVFFSWIFGFEGTVRIEGPKEVQTQYRKMVLDAAKRVK